ncbi:MAG: L-rhamnose isomerase [Kiritimatiellaeota bacterium]|nr:L-rhamnose isomerase [Kiritimatiellota bacterium]
MTTYTFAKEFYASRGIDTEAAIKRAAEIPLSIHAWQGDDVTGFERVGTLDGGLAATGNYPGKARNAEELRADIDQAFTLIPGPKRLSLHAFYAETHGKKIPRDELTSEHFANWIAWAKANKSALDYNASFFAHPLAADGLTLSHPEPKTRDFWIRHGVMSRRIANDFGKAAGSPSVINFWMPDGMKDTPFDRVTPRQRLMDALDQCFAEKLPSVLDAVECKLFGVGLESFTVGSHEFYMGYASSRQKLLCLDVGHFHPTETLADKIPSVLPFVPGVLLHLSRGVRWDSDHVVTLTDDLFATMDQALNCAPGRVYLALDYFDASINRIAAWAIGARNVRKAMLAAFLQPRVLLAKAEEAFDYSSRLALQEEAKTYPLLAVWDEACRRESTPLDGEWMPVVKQYEKTELSKRK